MSKSAEIAWIGLPCPRQLNRQGENNMGDRVNHYMSGDDWDSGGETIAPKGGTPVNVPPGSQVIGTVRRDMRDQKTGTTTMGVEEPLVGTPIDPKDF